MYHRNYTTYLQRELDFLKLLVSRFHEQEKVNGLELDVALQKTQEVYEQLLKIKLIPEADVSLPVIEKIIAPPVQPPVPPVQQPVPPVQQPAPPIQQPAPPKKEPFPKPQTENIVVPEKVVVVKEEKKQKTDPVKSGILADKLGTSDYQPINETLAQQKTGNDLSSKLQTAPLSSISLGIGLNDKFLFIRELFKSDNVLFNNTIKQLDSMGSLEKALDFVKHNFDWDEKNETAQKFVHLIHRRHGAK